MARTAWSACSTRWASRSVRATFFVQGRWVEAYPSVGADIATNGHLIGNHSYYHYRMNGFTRRQLIDDLERAEKVIKAETGVDSRPWFRLPFHAGAANRRTQRHLRAAGYIHVSANCDPRDWHPDATGGSVLESVMHEASRDLLVVDLHSWPVAAADALPRIIEHLQSRGASFVSVDELSREELESLLVSGPR